MSVYLHGLSMRANLSANLRAVLMALCDAAGEDDGTKCHPSVAYVSYKTGFSKRHIQRLLRTLELAGYIEAVAFIGGGRGHSTWYHVHIERVPMKPSWDAIKKRLIESGELADDDDAPPAAAVIKKAVLKRAEALKGDKMSAFSEKSLKGDKMSAFSKERVTKCPPLDPERVTKCRPSIPSKKEDSYEDEDSYADMTSTEKKPDGETTEPDPPSPLPPLPLDAGYVWTRAVNHLRAGRLGSQELASWIVPLRLVALDKTPGRIEAHLIAPGTDHARIVEQRYHGALASALGSVYGLPASRVTLSIAMSVPMSLEVAQ